MGTLAWSVFLARWHRDKRKIIFTKHFLEIITLFYECAEKSSIPYSVCMRGWNFMSKLNRGICVCVPMCGSLTILLLPSFILILERFGTVRLFIYYVRFVFFEAHTHVMRAEDRKLMSSFRY